MKKARNETGVVIEKGVQDWQILQRDDQGAAALDLAGRWSTPSPHRHAQVIVRLVDEARGQAVTLAHEWQKAVTHRDGTWSLRLAGIPSGGLYRLETALQLDHGPVEWAQRGDMAHHLGVGEVWILAGQSNSAGYGKTPAYDPPEPGLHLFHACGEWRLATHPLGDSTGTQYPPNRETANASHSPYLAFARRLKQALGCPIGLIPAALGGSPVSRWTRKVNGDLFANLLEYLRDAGGDARGMLWYQGESDTGPTERAVYARRFRDMVADLRRELGRPRAPVITCQLNRYIGEPYNRPTHQGWEIIREIQRQLARKLPGVYVISTLDLALSDGIHTNTSGNLVIGDRLADAALGAVYGQNVKWRHPEPTRARMRSPNTVELRFAHVDVRLHYENNILEQCPFAVRDAEGEAALAGWKLTGRDTLELSLARPLSGAATVTGAPTGCPPTIVPVDIGGYRPMLGFTIEIGK
jgi:hypothetical protein